MSKCARSEDVPFNLENMAPDMMAVTMCVRCGRENSRTAGICSACGARLPRLDLASPEVQVNVGELTERFNEFQQASERVLTEKWGLEDFEQFLHEMQEALKRRSRGFVFSETGEEAESYDGPPPEDTVHFLRGLDIMLKYLDESDENYLDEACLERALQVMREGNEKLLHGSAFVPPSDTPHLEAGPAHVTCVLCAFENPAGNSVCDKCGAKLPRIEQGAPEAKRPKVTDRYDRFKNAVDRVRSEEWSVEDFRAFLEEVERLLQAKRQSYFEVVNDSGYAEYAREEVDLGMSGIDDYDKGMALMWAFVDGAHGSQLDTALDFMWEGNEKLNRAMTMNRALRKELTEQFGYI